MSATRPERDGDRPWPLVEFLLRLREDEAQGVVRPLRDYLAAYPEHEAAIAAEYLQVRALDASDAPARPRLLGRFRLERELGRGGEGTVFLAYETTLGRQVALKLHHVAHWTELGEARLLRAATAAAKLDHEHLGRVLDAGREGATLWVAMQYVEGRTLAEELAARRLTGQAFAPTAAARLLAGLALGLQHAHERGVLHRDVKPSNVIVRAPEHAVLTDFGLARDLATADDLTLAGELRGTPAYMAPEQLDGAPGVLDARTDLWALGVLLFECVTLENPFAGASQAAVARAITERPLWAHPRFKALPIDLRAVLTMALAVDRAHRYANAAALADDLARLAAGQPVAARAPGRLARARAWARREPATAASLAGLAAVLLLGLAVSLHFWRAERESRAVAEARAARTRSVAESILFDMDDALVAGRGNVAMRQRLVARARDALLALYEENPGDLQLRRELALAWMRAGDVAGHASVGNRGDLAEAAHCFAAAEALARASLVDDPRAPVLLLSVQVKRADLSRADPPQARTLYADVVATADRSDPAAARLRAIALAQIAQIDRDAGELEAAAVGAAQAESELLAAAATLAKSPDHAFDLALLRDARATIAAASGDVDFAVDTLRAALADLDAAAADVDPARVAQVRTVLGLHHGQCLLLRGDAAAGLAALADVVDTWRARGRADPTDGGAAARLRSALEERGRALASLGRRDDATRDWREALELAERWSSNDAERLRGYLRAGAR